MELNKEDKQDKVIDKQNTSTKNVSKEAAVKQKEVDEKQKAMDTAKEELRKATDELAKREEANPSLTIEDARGKHKLAEQEYFAAKNDFENARYEMVKDEEIVNQKLVEERQRENL